MHKGEGKNPKKEKEIVLKKAPKTNHASRGSSELRGNSNGQERRRGVAPCRGTKNVLASGNNRANNERKVPGKKEPGSVKETGEKPKPIPPIAHYTSGRVNCQGGGQVHSVGRVSDGWFLRK